jgi:hypothetical protein
MNENTNELMNERTNEQTNERSNERTDGRMNERTNEPTLEKLKKERNSDALKMHKFEKVIIEYEVKTLT